MLPADLPAEWLRLAEKQDKLGVRQVACTLRHCAEELEAALDEQDGALLNLQEAAEESGYSADHLGRLVSEGKLPNAGERHAPRIRRADLPRKPGHRVERKHSLDEGANLRTQMARSVVESI